jgi:hypothetical protein
MEDAPRTATVIRWDGRRWTRGVTVPIGSDDIRVQPLPAGELLVAVHRSRRTPNGEAERNAAVYGPSGELRRRFVLGDGIEDVQSTAAGEVWVSYTLEGTMGDYGRYGWGRLSPEQWVDPVGYTGLVRFDAWGTRLQEFRPPQGLGLMNDCYALNVSARGAWACYHPDFPLVRVGVGEDAVAWRTGVPGVEALAVEGDEVLLYSHRGGAPRCWAARLGADRLEALAPVDTLPAPARDAATWVVGRHGALHAFDARTWYRLDARAD